MHHRIRLAFAVVLEHILLAIQEWVRRKRMVNTSLEHKQLKEKVCRAATRLRSLLSNCSTVVAVWCALCSAGNPCSAGPPHSGNASVT